jgi:hypothetical protein
MNTILSRLTLGEIGHKGTPILGSSRPAVALAWSSGGRLSY